MWCNQIFSLINEGTVQNIIVCDNYEVANQIARIQYGEDSIALDTTQYPLSVGCKYIAGVFYENDGTTIISRNQTADEEVEQINKQVEALNIALAEMMGV
ncbi:hypothetical protein [Anaerocolumna chitinilytica]|uniref:Uncharacterized protein n=1 Tax=Anaerocolumna chitinilytica TaxID=1727145 RepID=A0A7I8DUC9_9FIRM|nr:hypothetical protein [Anaerocolumna chitinilytica]BCK00852.1 hypothetical protein bsdcttw_38920 [Anaerocolumna chitinilytica]